MKKNKKVKTSHRKMKPRHSSCTSSIHVFFVYRLWQRVGINAWRSSTFDDPQECAQSGCLTHSHACPGVYWPAPKTSSAVVMFRFFFFNAFYTFKSKEKKDTNIQPCITQDIPDRVGWREESSSDLYSESYFGVPHMHIAVSHAKPPKPQSFSFFFFFLS